MKFLTSLILAGFLATGTAYATEEKKAPEIKTVCVDVQGKDGKVVIDPKTKKTCIKTTDAKTGKEVEKCKTVKLHEKHEGTKVDGATKDKK